MSAPTTTETKPAWKLVPGDKVFIYGSVPVTIVTVVWLPAFQPAQTVALTYRRDFDKGHILGQMTVLAGRSFPLYDDGEPF